ncbi:MAG: cytochrome c3 family protein [Thermoanaerobaculia bacterium]|jgi:hypothetical protein
MKRSALLTLALAMLAIAAAPVLGQGPTSCETCHADADLFEAESLQMMEDFSGGAHAAAGLSCHDCHGGNPDPAGADDMMAAMDEGWGENPYVGTPERDAIPGFCGRCHSDPTYMRRFKPDARVDQEREYWTSHHGIALRDGDLNVATCVDCHGVHGILAAGNPDSLVYPTQVAETCRDCHGDPERMSGYQLPNGQPLPIDQYARWRQSVHAANLLVKEDLSAPTCNDCHGNHGAAPPGLDSVTFVCGQCHGREAEMFRASPKLAAFELHNEFMAEAGPDGCAGCHEDPEPQASVRMTSLGECSACHGNHGIVRPSVGMLSPPPPTPCEFCHGANEQVAGYLKEPEAIRQSHIETRDALMAEAEAQGLEGQALFNWLIDQALTLPNHTLATSEGGDLVLRLEFERLFTKFRLGKTVFTYEDPVTGELTEGHVIRCDTCHASEPLLVDESKGLRVSGAIQNRMRELTSLTAGAERVLLRARRGGVETRHALAEIDQAVDAQIGLEVLVHGFAVDEDSEFMETHARGMEHAEAAFAAGIEAMDELAFRRKGLLVSLAVIVLVLIGLAFKIRQISARAD